jgi:glycosyltransferase involved in cell wall biosynthesis
MNSIDIVVPVYNEEKVLAHSICILWDFLNKTLACPWQIVVVDNGSVDGTLAVAKALSQQYPNVNCIHLDQKGRGRALKRAWLESSADVVSYMDVDLSTKLDAFPQLISAFDNGYSVAIGSRLMSGSKVIGRSLKREITSRAYNWLIKLMFLQGFSDAQCGFKAVKHDVVQDIVPLIEDNEWFFDTELLLLAARRGYIIKEVPVEWMDDPDSRVKVMKTAIEDIKGLLRVRFRPPF